jgi:hypothetical protein
MIRREAQGHFLLIAQPDHARLAAQFAAHIGNARFAPPLPHGPTIAAIANHDNGWADHDAHPTLNNDHLPLDVFETPLPLALAAWRSSSDKAETLGEYTALLVSLHGLGLSAIPASRQHTQREVFDLNKFQHHEIERQVRLRQLLGLPTDVPLRFGLAEPGTSIADDQLLFNVRMLQAMDHLSLALLCQDNGNAPLPVFERIEGVHPRPGDAPLSLRLRRHPSHAMLVDPWPFDIPTLSFQVPFRRAPARSYTDAQDLHSACAAAPVDHLTVTIRSP